MKRFLRTLLGTGLLCAAFQLAAQQPTDPPPVLRIFREDIKEGKAAAHERTEAKFAQAMLKNKYPVNSLGMTTISGMNQAWFLEAHASFASIGQSEAALSSPDYEMLDTLDAESRASSRSWIAVYRADMSYHAKELVETLPKARYINVITFRVRQGKDEEFAAVAKTAVAALAKSGSDQPAVAYQIVSGSPNGVYLLFEPTASMKTFDDQPARSRAFYQAMGDSGMKKFTKDVNDAVASTEAVLFQFNPKMSYVSKEFAAGDPDFWTPKPAKGVTSAKPAAKRVAAK
ncbi:MAG TPA: hypothetical protein VEU96_15375 [Bryobacteraceae bacterium]|nr:hypothetical protein [Bryobacteraceae bacterium]